MAKFKLYYFSPTSLSFAEARWFKTKFASLAIVLGMVIVVLVLELNRLHDDALGLGLQRGSVLAAENVILKDQLRLIGNRLDALQKRLLVLNDQGNELRLLVDLPKIDDDTREAGIGGTDQRIDFGVPTGVNQLLNRLRTTVEKAERELQLQQTSYSEAVRAYEVNREKYARLPAIKPMEGFYSIHGYGVRLHPIFRVRKFHEGIDISNDRGTPVYATGNGIVESAGRMSAGYGNMIVVDHGFGYTSLYGHLEKILVAEGRSVKRGDMIGRCGNTGISTNPHLHYEVRKDGVLQNPVDFFFDDVDYQKIRSELAMYN